MRRSSPSQEVVQSLLKPRYTAPRASGKFQILALVLLIVALYSLSFLFEKEPEAPSVRRADGIVYMKEVRGSGNDRAYMLGVRIADLEAQDAGLAFTCTRELWDRVSVADHVRVTYRMEEGGRRASLVDVSRVPVTDKPPSGTNPGANGAALLTP
jgi:hypothetical protein